MGSIMQANTLPRLDTSVNTTGCCPKFNPDGWDGVALQLRDLPVLRARTCSVMHLPLNMGKVFGRVQTHLQQAGTQAQAVLSSDLSPWQDEHLFVVDGPVSGEEMATLSGDFVTRVFEGPYGRAKHWMRELRDMSRARGKPDGRAFFYYTTCPKCAKAYGKNYVVGFAEI